MRIALRRIIPVTLTVLFMAACSDTPGSPDPIEPADENDSCVECHSDYDALKTLHTPDSVMPPEGCSGPPPYVEPYDRVYLEPTGFASYQATTHGEMGCTECHGGVDGTSNKQTAHSGTFLKHPSFENVDVCKDCHSDLVAGFTNGLHYNGWGQKNSQIRRSGVGSFDELHEGVQIGYQANCATCHASCGSCHVNRPPAQGGGLMDGHSFGAPDMRDNCTACHSSRGGHAYYGEGLGTQPDVHLTAAGYTCLDCHTTNEMHASTGKVYDHRYQVAELPKCSNCHESLESANQYHKTHIEDMNCNTCHSQDYNNCGNCHVGGEGARIHSYQGFKIGLNPIPEERDYKFATLRRTLAAPDSWEAYGLAELPSFDSKPLFNYTTPHNIQRWTTRTSVADGASCSSSCHIREVDGVTVNKELYLFSSDFENEWEKSATKTVVVDGALPAYWGNH